MDHVVLRVHASSARSGASADANLICDGLGQHDGQNSFCKDG